MNARIWLKSVYSDGSRYYVSNPEPKIGEQVTIRLRVLSDSPVEHVFFRYFKNGHVLTPEMEEEKRERGLTYYRITVFMTQVKLRYSFVLTTSEEAWFYNQKEIADYPLDDAHAFVIHSGYHQPVWIKDAVFYQIFPERFCNGDSSNDVKDGEVTQNGYLSQQIKEWNSVPTRWNISHCLDFYGGDFAGIEAKLPYLKELGVNAIYLNPSFHGPSVHKYDCIDYFHMDPHFGGDEGFASLMKAVHENGMKLVLDISINHTGIAHLWFNRDGVYGPKTIGAYNNPDAPERHYYVFEEGQNYRGWDGVMDMPVLDYSSKELREILYKGEHSVLRKWLREPYCIDGWRFDVADVMAKNDINQLEHEVWPEIRQAIREENPDAYILAEDWGDNAEHLQGEEWDAPMNYYAFARLVRQFYGLPDPFLGRNPMIFQRSAKLSAQAFRNRLDDYYGRIPYALRQNMFNLFDSHDVGRLHNFDAISERKYEGAVLMLLTMIGVPNIYYGDEAGIDGRSDDLEGCRYPMPWDSGFEEKHVYGLYRRLIALRNEEEAIRDGGFTWLFASGKILSYARFSDSRTWVIVVSADHMDQQIELPLAILGSRRVLSENLLGHPLCYEECEGGIRMNVQAETAYLFLCE